MGEHIIPLTGRIRLGDTLTVTQARNANIYKLLKDDIISMAKRPRSSAPYAEAVNAAILEALFDRGMADVSTKSLAEKVEYEIYVIIREGRFELSGDIDLDEYDNDGGTIRGTAKSNIDIDDVIDRAIKNTLSYNNAFPGKSADGFLAT